MKDYYECFDDWFNDQGYDIAHKSVFETVWDAAIDNQKNKES
jgi:hypothetical protein